MLNDIWVQELLNYECTLEVPSFPPSASGSVGRAAIDGALVVYDLESPPAWLIPVLDSRNEDGCTPAFEAAERLTDSDTTWASLVRGDDALPPSFHCSYRAPLTASQQQTLLGAWKDIETPGRFYNITRAHENGRTEGLLFAGGEIEHYVLASLAPLQAYYRKLPE